MSRDPSLHASSLNKSPVVSGHTPTPWHAESKVIDGWEGQRQSVTISSGKTLIADYVTDFVEYPGTDEENAANAAFIVRAVNSHEALVKALETFVEEYTDLVNSGDAGFWDPEKEPKVIAARAALTSAREVQP